jgi:hypothetical protein
MTATATVGEGADCDGSGRWSGRARRLSGIYEWLLVAECVISLPTPACRPRALPAPTRSARPG